MTLTLAAAFAVLTALLPSTAVFAGDEPSNGTETPVVAEQVSLADISDYLAEELASSSEPVSFLVVLDDQVDASALVLAADGAELDRTAKASLLYRTLTEHASASQAPLRAWLEERNISYRPFYIVNMIEVHGDIELATELRKQPTVNRLIGNPQVVGQQVVSAMSETSWLQPAPVKGEQSMSNWATGLYGLALTNAPEVWAMGYRGQGIVVASQDTGVKWDHPAIKDQYRGWDQQTNAATHRYNWFDAFGVQGNIKPFDECGPNHQIPCDDYGHGTHTLGTILGDASDDSSDEYYNPKSIIGMAPEAEWVACRNMHYGEGSPVSYTDCFQFMLAPYPQNGDPFTDGRPELAPHIINNSWSCPAKEGCEPETLRQIVETTRAAGQLIVASASNAGPSCNTIQNPIGIYDESFTVGAHDFAGTATSFSSRGPVVIDNSGRMKPDISAPGQSVLSARSYNGYDSYDYASGTSMAAPHVAGAAALLWSAAPELIGNIDLTEQVLMKSATPVLDAQCLNGAPAASPNPVYGYGQLNALAAVNMALSPWELEVRATDSQGKSQASKSVVVVDERTGYSFTRWTNADGVAKINLIYNGSYTLRVGGGDQSYVRRNIVLSGAGNPDEDRRKYVIDATFPDPTGLDSQPQPPTLLFLPRIDVTN